MTARTKPEFGTAPGFWIDPAYLPDAVRLSLHIEARKSGLTPEQQEKLVRFAGELAQMPNLGDEAIATQRDQITKIASEARRLLASLKGLSPAAAQTLAMYARDALVERPPSLSPDMADRLSGMERNALLDEAWEWANAVEAVSEYAASQLEPSRQAKPKQARARALVSNLAGFYWRMTGEFPAADPAAWFAGFTDRLGEQLGLEIGPRIVKSGIEDAKR
ncbi:hypothetical protein [Pseudoxanthomonas sp.]|jgi:hypothetical protein|uniref:hypothetical protein n=1 Tax=Pseudoxanthomonas sp. TaxID=1871049 RepID=UPI002E139018|nr:hypothetical protein [Pseudoxanthomonas sp.]